MGAAAFFWPEGFRPEGFFAEVPRETRIHPGHGPWGITLGEAEPYARMFM